MTEDDRKVISNKIDKHGMDSLTDKEMEHLRKIYFNES